MADSDASGGTFPAADVSGELNACEGKVFKVDGESSQIANSLENKEQAEARAKKEEMEKKESMQTLKTAILVSAVVVAVAAAAFAITKKLKEK